MSGCQMESSRINFPEEKWIRMTPITPPFPLCPNFMWGESLWWLLTAPGGWPGLGGASSRLSAAQAWSDLSRSVSSSWGEFCAFALWAASNLAKGQREPHPLILGLCIAKAFSGDSIRVVFPCQVHLLQKCGSS